MGAVQALMALFGAVALLLAETGSRVVAALPPRRRGTGDGDDHAAFHTALGTDRPAGKTQFPWRFLSVQALFTGRSPGAAGLGGGATRGKAPGFFKGAVAGTFPPSVRGGGAGRLGGWNRPAGNGGIRGAPGVRVPNSRGGGFFSHSKGNWERKGLNAAKGTLSFFSNGKKGPWNGGQNNFGATERNPGLTELNLGPRRPGGLARGPS